MGKEKKTKKQRAIIRRERELREGRFGRNRMVMISSVIIAIVAVSISIYFGVSAIGEERENVENTADTRQVVTVTPKTTATPPITPAPPQVPKPKPTTETDSNPKSKPSGLIKAKWIEPELNADIVSIPVSEVQNNLNIHFGLDTTGGKTNFMAYIVDGNIHVRANVCPPCRSVGFSLQKDILVCDRCKTTFEAKTGNGIQGACVDYPKAAVPYSVTDGNIVMSIADLKAATQDTILPG